MAEKEKGHSVAEGIAVGGHAGKAIIVGPGKDQISKRLNEGADELEFYKGFAKMDWKGGERFFPKYFGTFENEDGLYMTLENLMAGLGDNTCVMDVKMGTQTYAPNAPAEKIAHQSANDAKTTTPLLGQRLTGYKVYDPATKKTEKVGKEITFTVKTRADLIVHFAKFWGGHKAVIASTLPWLRDLLQWFSEKPTARLYSSSILFCYDPADPKKPVSMRLIDFAHVFPITDGGKDEGYVHGLKEMIKMFEDLSK